MNPKDDQFKKIKEHWYNQLKEDGFKDIEESQERGLLKRIECSYFKSNYTEMSFAAIQDYFIRAEHFLNSHCFGYIQEREIWRLHSQGKTMREIQRELFFCVPVPRHIKLYRVRVAIEKLRAIMMEKVL